MKSLIHYPTCRVWASGDWSVCDCTTIPAWRIRKEEAERFPWRIWRRTGDFSYEHVMRCSTWEGAVELVQQFIWLRENAVQRETHG